MDSLMNKLDIMRVYANGRLNWRDREYKCSIGKSGVSDSKKEGDGATPAGRYPLREVFYRPDRLPRPNTRLPVSKLRPLIGWNDDINHINYNTKVILPHNGRVEKLWRQEHVYDLIVVIGYNDNPPARDKGSAIFIHIAKKLNKLNYAATEGCIALSQESLLEILKDLSVTSQIEILDP
jgi:L,D-peptidoglycan transpeptidase YkuD (ErfK/YbiS/YcfS/YnhG family)